ncbi:MAG: prenyltransferase/squalene oxidase repeat-containing protein, partial [Anaerolineales bacterium]
MDKKKIRKLIFFCSLIFLFLFSNPFLTLVHAQTEQTTDNHVEKTITQAFGFIATQMNPDGGIRWVDETSSMGATLRAVWALAAAGYSQDYLKHESGNRPIDFLANASSAWVNQAESEKPGFSVARAGQLLTAIAAANENPHYFGLDARDFLYEININYDPTNGIYGDSISENVVDQLWAMIGLAANNASVPEKAVNWLTSTQLADGSWNDGYGNYLDTTPLAVLALLSSEHRAIDATEILSAFAYLQKNQHLNGGWQTVWDTQTNASTSSSVLQAINASGQEPKSANWQKEEGQPLNALLNLAQSNGAIGGDFTNAYSTADAIVGLSGKWVTRLGDVENASEAIDYLISKQESSGGWGSIGQTIDVLLALHAIGWEPNTVVTSDATPLQAISGDLKTYLESGPDAVGKAILGLTALGENPLNFEGNDLHQRIMAYYDETSQAFGSPENSWHQAFSILGLHALGVDIPQGAVQTLINLQQHNGGWEYTPGLGTWPDHTALAIQALLASGQLSGSVKIKHALAYIRSMQ